MKATILKKAAVLAGSLSFLAGSAFSQTAVSGAGGYTTYNLAVGFNLIGISLLDPVALNGTIDAEAGATITDADVDFTTLTGGTYLIEILSGTQSGAVAEIASVVDADNITLNGALGAGTADYQIRKAPTLGELFGTSLAGAAVVPTATTDRVWLPDGAGGFNQYYFRTGAINQFRAVASPNTALPEGVPVFYPDALFVQVASAPKSVVITGMVKTTGTVVAANTGFNLVGVTPPVGATFGNSKMKDFLQASVGPVPNAATDRVWLPNGAGGFNQFFVNNAGLWKSVALPAGASQDDTALTSGLFIQRSGASTAGVLDVPTFYANL
jgi:hypothetical protein